MNVHPLPDAAQSLLAALDAPPHLIRHHALVHDAESRILTALEYHWPTLPVDRQAVLFGAATHDIGKILHPAELTGPGSAHEDDGPALLQANGISVSLSRFARSHGRWAEDPDAPLEDLLVAWADTVWKAKRAEALESRLASTIAAQTGEDAWRVYMILDDIATDLGRDAEARIAWQSDV